MDSMLADRLSRLSPEQRARLTRLTTPRPVAAAPIPLLDRSTGRLPMSFAQRRLYFLQNLEPDGSAYNVVEALRVRGPLDLAAMRGALSAVVDRHEVLRTKCAAGDPDPELVIATRSEVDAELTLRYADLGGGPDAAVSELFARLAETPFRLDEEFPLRVTLARLGDDDHALLFVAHHIATDAWSSRRLVREFFHAYTALAAGGAPAFEPLPVQYGDYAAWQRERLDEDHLRGHLGYWREQLADLPPILELPLDRPRPATRSDAGAEVRFTLDGALVRRLRTVAREASVTPFVLLLTAFGHVLHRHCATEDVVVGTPVAGRDRPEVEELLGCFVNTLVLRLDLSPVPTCRDLVQRVRECTLDAYEHQDLQFERLVAELAPERDLGANRLVQVMFNYHAATELAESVPGLSVTPVEVGGARARFDLSCALVETGDELRGTLTYAAELLSRGMVERLGAHLTEALEALLADLDAPLTSLPPVPSADTEAVRPGPAHVPEYDASASLLARFETHAARNPARPAVRCRDDVAGYGELNERANRLAGHLVAGGTVPGDLVALLFERSVDHVVAMLAAQKAGAAYVPLDPAAPAGHIAAVLAESGATVLLTHTEVDRAGLPAPDGVVVVDVDEIGAELAGRSPADLGRLPAGDEAMYVVFTSGSTGRPKGVVVEHGNFTNYITGILDRLEVPDGLSFALVSTLAADLGLTNLYGALATGGTVHVLPYEWAVDPDQLAGYFTRHPIDFLKLVPSHLQAVRDAGLLSAVVPARHLILAGEACPWDLVDAVHQVRPECAVWNNYGPTETTVAVLAHPVPAERGHRGGAAVPLGSAIANVQVRVVDRYLRPVPVGAAGELLITGASVARGYLSAGEPRGTGFVRDPFSDDPAARAYRSGDRGRLLPSGVFEFLGRLDRQAKIRGYRVEPGYIEAVLRGHPAIADVAVAVRHDGDGRARLVAYCVPGPNAVRPNEAGPNEAGSNGTGPDGTGPNEAGLADVPTDVPAEVRTPHDYAREKLPPYMVPAAFVELDRLPITPNGKLDWRALPEPGPRPAGDRPVTPPRDAADERLAAIWREVLGLPEVGIDDDFFALGGDSFTAMRLARRIGDGLRVAAVFQHPTIRELADLLGADGADGAAGAGGLLCRLPGRAPGATVTATVVAVPFGGGSAAAYGTLAKALPADFPLFAVELPGHDFGNADVPLEPSGVLAERCVAEIRASVEGPVIVYGHCLGAAMAFDIARRLSAEGGDVVGVVFGGAFPAPRLPGRIFELWARFLPSDRWRSDRLYRDTLRGIGGLTEELDPAEQAFVLRALRHDSRQAEQFYSDHCHAPGRERTLHALSVVGERDRLTEFHEERYREWDMLCAETEIEVIPDAGHFFLKHQAGELATILTRWYDRRRPSTDTGDPPARTGGTLAETGDPPAESQGTSAEADATSGEAGVTSTEAGGASTETGAYGGSGGVYGRPARSRVTPAPAPATGLWGFLLVTLGQLVSMLGTRALAFGLGVWVYLKTGSATQFSVILVCGLLPALLVLPFAGAAADRWNRRLVMIVGDLVAVLGSGLCLVLYAAGSLEVWHLYIATGLTSIAAAFQQPAYLAATAQLVPKRYLGRTNGITQALVALSQAGGPLLGGALILLIDLSGLLVVDLVTVVVSLLTLLAVRFPNTLFRRREESIWKEISNGVRYIARRPSFVAMIVYFLAFNLILGFAIALTPPMVLAFASPAALSVASTIGAVGGIIGGVAMALWGGFARRATGMVGFTLLTGAGMVVVGLIPSALFLAVGLAAIAASLALLNGHWQTMIQTKVGMELQGRILASNRMIANLTEPLGYLLAGQLADAVFEPAMRDGGWLSGSAGGVLGTGPGRGMALMIVILGVAQILLATYGLRWRTLRYMEDVLPDAIPGAVVTWDRDALQQEADRLLDAKPLTPARHPPETDRLLDA
ncbi:non-ribosomal peptide synthetase/MFS transporter [Sphaerisporangium corydalis]|uniref:Amino acid adenylation domain-containing protein n=1 Tax=Sphaerisporangium corydalis TaxID=1441875 RepID=A0ABV9EI12_9ACTN|nr:non-ribosomal peptide synthetase/MFS transporter [Sphaerisporangium corydalis]